LINFSCFSEYDQSGVLFKVSHDVPISSGKYLYGGNSPNHELSCKAAAQELLAAQRLASVFHDPFIIVPQQTIIDYKGVWKPCL
jgi:hypothetical protein